MHLEPVGEEAQQLPAHRIGIDPLAQIAVPRDRLLERIAQRQTHSVFQDQSNGAECGATQAKWIL